MTDLAYRIRLARRRKGISQSALAKWIGVQRSAVSHWEAPQGRSPTLTNLRRIASVLGIRFEWLATGRSAIALSVEDDLDSVPAVQALLVDDEVEMRILSAVRRVPVGARNLLVEVAEHFVLLRYGRAGNR